ncbi:MAG: hypothetical protein J7L50_00480 [Candidatus Odinarchaeota archaeon]|nr:hypothetical protein [Candidatus Odinarchaeota archaeon]
MSYFERGVYWLIKSVLLRGFYILLSRDFLTVSLTTFSIISLSTFTTNFMADYMVLGVPATILMEYIQRGLLLSLLIFSISSIKIKNLFLRNSIFVSSLVLFSSSAFLFRAETIPLYENLSAVMYILSYLAWTFTMVLTFYSFLRFIFVSWIGMILLMGKPKRRILFDEIVKIVMFSGLLLSIYEISKFNDILTLLSGVLLLISTLATFYVIKYYPEDYDVFMQITAYYYIFYPWYNALSILTGPGGGIGLTNVIMSVIGVLYATQGLAIRFEKGGLFGMTKDFTIPSLLLLSSGQYFCLNYLPRIGINIRAMNNFLMVLLSTSVLVSSIILSVRSKRFKSYILQEYTAMDAVKGFFSLLTRDEVQNLIKIAISSAAISVSKTIEKTILGKVTDALSLLRPKKKERKEKEESEGEG